jgi:hypothetical protein
MYVLNETSNLQFLTRREIEIPLKYCLYIYATMFRKPMFETHIYFDLCHK